MKKLILALGITIVPVALYAATCTTHTYNVDGKEITCVTCCEDDYCNTTCD